MGRRHLDGLFYRIVPAARADQALAPAVSPEGRFHHSGRPTLYVSSRPDWAEHAIATYVRDTDPPRVICELRLTARSSTCAIPPIARRRTSTPPSPPSPGCPSARRACPPPAGPSPTAPAPSGRTA
ncbi:MAG: hypothetical protein V4720_01575 [Pseudomonadota bacterium]